MSEATGVLLRGLPFEADQDDIKQFFSSLSILHSNIQLIITFDGKFSGLAFVQLRDSEEMKIALLMDRNHMGGRYIDVMTVSEEKLDQIKKAASNGLGRRELHRMCGDSNRPMIGRGRGRDEGNSSRGGRNVGRSVRERSKSPPSGSDRFAYFNGFPEDVLYKGVRTFFEDCAIGKGCVHLFRGENGKFRGDGYVEFVDPMQLRKGLRKDGMVYRDRRIDVEPCSQHEVQDNLRFMMDRTGPNAFSAEPDPLYGGYRRHEERDYRRGSGDRGRSKGSYRDTGGEDRWSTGGNYRRNEERHEPLHHHHYIEERRYESDYGSNRRQEAYSSHHRDYRHLEHDGYIDHHKGSGGSGTDGRTLRMHGLHPSVKIADILSFFKNYGVQYEDVRIQCHDDGTPNGRAFVSFPSERISSAAYHDMNRRMLKNTYVELFPV